MDKKSFHDRKKIAVIAGAGPAGLTAASELLIQTEIEPVIFESTSIIGGISQTVNHNGNRMDIGGHRFFSKNQRVTDFWESKMPFNANAETTDRVMLRRPRISRIFFLRKFFDYPISLKWRTFANMGLMRTVSSVFSFMASKINKKEDDTLENFYINRFGKKLYSMFFEDYTEKVWGVHPSKLGADWGSQRVKGLSITAILRDMLLKATGLKGKGKVETSLIEEFSYPKYGPGQLWEAVASDLVSDGVEIGMEKSVEKIYVENNKVKSIAVRNKEGIVEMHECDYFLSSMPIKDLVMAIEGVDVPQEVKEIASTLPYRDFITVGLLVDTLAITDKEGKRIPDTWIYIQERDVKIGRLQVFNNWSPYMVADGSKTWIGLEYFCNEGDELWNMGDEEFIKFAISELEKIGIIEGDSVRDSVRIKIRKAYPAYYGSYYKLDKVKEFLDGIENLYCIGRNGQHRYNNMDHSMLTAMEAVDAIAADRTDKASIWAVNSEEEYHETK